MWLYRLAFTYVTYHGFGCCSAIIVPNLFPHGGMNPCYETKKLTNCFLLAGRWFECAARRRAFQKRKPIRQNGESE